MFNTTKIPRSLGNVTTLKTLSLTFSTSEVIPETIGNLVNLERLSLSANEITSLPETFRNLKKVEFLYLYTVIGPVGAGNSNFFFFIFNYLLKSFTTVIPMGNTVFNTFRVKFTFSS